MYLEPSVRLSKSSCANSCLWGCVRMCVSVCLSEAAGSAVNGANWPSELFPVMRRRKPLGMCRGQHAIYLGNGWVLKLARGTSLHTHTHTHPSILLPFAWNAKAHLCSFASNTNTLQKFFPSIPPLFLFLETIQLVFPLRLRSLTTLFMCPFPTFYLFQKAPLRQKLYNQRCNASFSDVPFFLMVKRMDLIPRHSQTGPWERSTLRGTTAGELWACRSTLLPHYCADASHVCCLLSVMSAASAAIFPLETEYQKIIYLC